MNGSSRVEVDDIMAQIRGRLGSQWDRYRVVITHFLTGRLTRSELQEELQVLLPDASAIRLHNKFLLANLTNALQDGPGAGRYLSGWGNRGGRGAAGEDDPYGVQAADGQFTKLKDDIMGLSVRERKRIKAIAKDPQPKVTVPPTVIATRQALLPKIPLLQNGQGSTGGPSSSTSTPSAANTTAEVKEESSEDKTKKPNGTSTQSNSSASTPATTTNTAANSSSTTSNTNTTTSNTTQQSFTADIMHAYDASLSTDTYELPDAEALSIRMLGVSLEHGLLQGIDPAAAEVMLAGLEHYLRDLVQQAFERVKRRRELAIRNESTGAIMVNGTSSLGGSVTGGSSAGVSVAGDLAGDAGGSSGNGMMHEDTITVEDLACIIESAPTCFVEVNGPLFRMNDSLLMNDDESDPAVTGATDIDALLDGILCDPRNTMVL
ncbi:uncharacterized protein SAPINGB_P002578 [Magnusiomyces paraingens]|uniref:Transcriptional coactivator HFI1/ADA1 n=1 Tax=Magnusiomyces paraingens TaxID=2606893 RepID=A0A5E8BEM9_9ASCO|nr:uncharacterized protein SAPINGB_P002578 [Saprochaete ingens]VVT50055.1 unnamed protein product [Saprochaete ingens]